ncbi:MAG: hypothetical protein JRN03_05315 [Nitrososphaerota archaeon]|nr:hypothetical protein [Nitrososphaerota archaeon]
MSKKKESKEIEGIREEVDMMDLMLSSLVDVLEEKGMIRHDEWERKIKERLSSK